MSVQSQQNTPNKQQPGQQYGNKSVQQDPAKTGQQYGNSGVQPSVGNGVADRDRERSASSNGTINMGRDPGTPGQNPEDRDNVWKDNRKMDKSDPSCASNKKGNAA